MTALRRLGLESDAFPWYHSLRRSGDAGRRWVEAYEESGCHAITENIDRALVLLRQRDFTGGRALLDASHRAIESADRPPEAAPVLWRWYLSALAYDRYCRDALDEATTCLDEATRHIEDGIARYPFLLMMASHCYDFRLQRARIERKRRRWHAMHGHIARGRAMLNNRRPLCVLPTGASVWIGDVDAFFSAVPLGSHAERAAIREVIDHERRQRIFERLARDTWNVPHVVIPYRPAAVRPPAERRPARAMREASQPVIS